MVHWTLTLAGWMQFASLRQSSGWSILILSYLHSGSGQGSVVDIATGHGLDGPGSNPGGGKIFHTCPDRPWGPPSLLCNGYRVFPRGKEWPGHDTDPSPPSSAVGHERAELYLYSPYRLYSLYRTSVPVQGCTLPLPLPFTLRYPTVSSLQVSERFHAHFSPCQYIMLQVLPN
jgi:hypothetical protein